MSVRGQAIRTRRTASDATFPRCVRDPVVALCVSALYTPQTALHEDDLASRPYTIVTERNQALPLRLDDSPYLKWSSTPSISSGPRSIRRVVRRAVGRWRSTAYRRMARRSARRSMVKRGALSSSSRLRNLGRNPILRRAPCASQAPKTPWTGRKRCTATREGLRRRHLFARNSWLAPSRCSKIPLAGHAPPALFLEQPSRRPPCTAS